MTYGNRGRKVSTVSNGLADLCRNFSWTVCVTIRRRRPMKPGPLILFSTLSILLLISEGQPGAQTPQRDNRPRTASVGGRVTIGGAPAPNARVGLVEVKHQTRLGNQHIFMESGGMNAGEDYSALTEADGRYRLTNLPEGNYEARVMLKAYIAEKKTGDNDLVRPVSLGEGE